MGKAGIGCVDSRVRFVTIDRTQRYSDARGAFQVASQSVKIFAAAQDFCAEWPVLRGKWLYAPATSLLIVTGILGIDSI
ncbi:MAG: hypothetical protein ACE5G0_18910, partial [Rhodothermales bacterium]